MKTFLKRLAGVKRDPDLTRDGKMQAARSLLSGQEVAVIRGGGIDQLVELRAAKTRKLLFRRAKLARWRERVATRLPRRPER